MGEAGRRRVLERFDAPVVADTVLRVCREAMARV
jgi:hypothetical protein